MLDVTWPLVRPLMFSLDAERAHSLTLAALERFGGPLGALASATMGPPPPALSRRVGPLTVRGPVGLAAGLDKDGVATAFWPHLGFGFVEVGTVTAHPQPGNERPRMFRFPAHGAIINRMGFNNRGSAALADRLERLRRSGRWPAVPVGANVGKSKVTPLEEAAGDYATSISRLDGLVDWFTINVSSPNTPGLRSLQTREALSSLLPAITTSAGDTPWMLKLAPDLDDDALHTAVEVAREHGVSGIIATNTTLGRDGLPLTAPPAGGLSGRPLWRVARDRIRVVLEAAQELPVIGVGGISRADQVLDLLDAGCAAIQVYSGLVFEGPGLPSRLNRAVLEHTR